MTKLPLIYFGEYNEKPVDWRGKIGDDQESDDELLDVTPEDVVGMLGFDPLEEFGPRDGGNKGTKEITKGLSLDSPIDEPTRFQGNIWEVIGKGGPGSGNFGHRGRPGKVGGSGTGGKISIRGEAASNKIVSDLSQGSSVLDTDVIKSNKRLVEDALYDKLNTDSDFNKLVDNWIGSRRNESSYSDPMWDFLGTTTHISINDNKEKQEHLREGIRALIHSWANTSGDHDEQALVIQKAVNKEFKLSNNNLDTSKARVLDREEMRGLRKFVRAQYDNTQRYFRDSNISSVNVYRGIRLPVDVERSGRGDLLLSPLSSFSLDRSRAEGFMSHGEGRRNPHLIVINNLSVKNILSIPLTGFGCTNEKEVVVLGRNLMGDWVSHVKKSVVNLSTDLIDDNIFNADWVKYTWDLPPYKSNEFNRLGIVLSDFRKLPIYLFAVESGLIVNDKWIGSSKKSLAPAVTKADDGFSLDIWGAIAKGGAGSGNHGHAGRPGKVGGSGTGGDFGLEEPPNSGFTLNEKNLSTEIKARKEFQRAIKEQYGGNVPCFHEAPISVLDSIRKNGLTSGESAEDTNFATIGAPSGFVSSKDKLIVKFMVETRIKGEKGLLVPDMRYGGSNEAHAELLREHKGLYRADVAYNDRVRLGQITYIAVIKDNELVGKYIYPFDTMRKSLAPAVTKALSDQDSEAYWQNFIKTTDPWEDKFTKVMKAAFTKQRDKMLSRLDAVSSASNTGKGVSYRGSGLDSLRQQPTRFYGDIWGAIAKGGAGSGNYGHAGRPGKVGGSGTGGSRVKPKENYVFEKERLNRAHIDPVGVAGTVSFLMRDLNLDKEQAKEMATAIFGWSSFEYREIRSGRDKKKAELLNKLTTTAASWDGNGPLYRGIILPLADAQKIKSGVVMDMKGLSSWSSDKRMAESFTNAASSTKEVKVIFTIQKTTDAVSIAHLSSAPHEKEVLYSSSVLFKVKEVSIVKNKMTVVVEEVVQKLKGIVALTNFIVEKRMKKSFNLKDKWQFDSDYIGIDVQNTLEKSLAPIVTKADDGFSPDERQYFADLYKMDRNKWDAEIQARMATMLEGITADVGGKTFAELVGGGAVFNVRSPQMRKFVDDWSYKLAFDINDETYAELKRVMGVAMDQGLGNRGVRDAVKNLFDNMIGTGWELDPDKANYRAMRIARTETMRASNYGFEQACVQSGVVEGKKWITARDERRCKLCSSMHGKILGLNENYFSKGDVQKVTGDDGEVISMVHDYADVKAPPLHPQCRCFIDGQVPVYTSTGWKAIAKVAVGDLVLTHEKRFRKVIEVVRTPKQLPTVSSILVTGICTSGKNSPDVLTVTGNHPVLTSNGWKNAGDVIAGDTLQYLSTNCARCDKPVPIGFTYCSYTCRSLDITDRQWADPKHRENMSNKAHAQMLSEYSNGTRDPYKITMKANEAARKLIKIDNWLMRKDVRERIKGATNLPHHRKASSDRMKKNNPMHIPGLAKKTSEKTMETFKKYPDRHPNRRMAEKGFMSSLERSMKSLLEALGVDYEQQCMIDRFFVDFALWEYGIVIEVDGEYWHQDKEKDINRQRIIESYGWTVLRFSEKSMRKRLPEVQLELVRVLSNHDGDYGLIGMPVVSVRKWVPKRAKTLYNLTVEEDESYIAKGFVVHNCTLVPLIKEEFIGEGKKSVRVREERDPFTSNPIASEEPRSKDSINSTYIAKIKGDGEGIFKVEKEEQGNLQDFYDSCHKLFDLRKCSMVRREVMASQLNDTLGLDFIPKTVLKESTRDVGVGSVQKWVDNLTVGRKGRDQYYEMVLSMEKTEAAAVEAQKMRMAVFDDILGSTDRHAGNVGFDGKRLWFIDNGLSFAHSPYRAWNGNFIAEYLQKYSLRMTEEYAEAAKEMTGVILTKRKEINSIIKELPLPERKAFWRRVEQMNTAKGRFITVAWEGRIE